MKLTKRKTQSYIVKSLLNEIEDILFLMKKPITNKSYDFEFIVKFPQKKLSLVPRHH